MKKKIISFVMAIAVVTGASAGVFAHSGRAGGHHGRAAGGYHHGCGGYGTGEGAEADTVADVNAGCPCWDGDRYWDGCKYVTGFCDIDGTRHCFDGKGRLYKNKWVSDSEGSVYYIDGSGKVCTGWKCIDGCTYYFGETGKRVTGDVCIDGTNYSFDENGKYLLEARG